jgi:hypothetical protein
MVKAAEDFGQQCGEESIRRFQTKGMTTYYYDEEARTLIAVNEETNEVRLIEPLRLDSEPVEHITHKPKTPKSVRGKGAGCPECSSPSRHRKDCSRAGSTASRVKLQGNKEWHELDDAPKVKTISRMHFGRVKIAHSHNIPVETIAADLGFDESEVSKVIEADTYDDYLKS